MHEASVGFQCGPCVNVGRAAVRQPRTVFGGRISANPTSVTTAIIIANVVVFVLGLFTGGRGLSQFGDMWGFGVASGEYWRLITAAFLHAGLAHLAFNMLALYLFGPVIEEALGRARYLATYVTVAVAASVWVYWLTDPRTSTVGASGAVFGLLGVVFVFMWRSKQDMSGMIVLLAINAFISLQANVSWQAHLGGFVTGLLIGWIFIKAKRETRDRTQLLAFAGIWIVLVIAVLARSAQLAVFF